MNLIYLTATMVQQNLIIYRKNAIMIISDCFMLTAVKTTHIYKDS